MDWLKQICLRRQSLAARCLAATIAAVTLLVCLLWGAVAFGATRPYFPEDETPQQRYWRKLHEREAAQQTKEVLQQSQRRDEIKASVADMVEAGAAFQAQLIVAQDGLPLQRKPSVFDGKRDFVIVGLAGLLVVVLTVCTLTRHKREAEIRALAGNYLSDGTEAARFEMPAFFATPMPERKERLAFLDELPEAPKPEDDPAKMALKAFFTQAPERVAGLRTLLANFGKAFDDTERQQVLTKLYESICALKGQANTWDLRPVWQMTSALELLLKRLVEVGSPGTELEFAL